MSLPAPRSVPRAVIIGVGTASALVPLNSTMISVALRSVASDFGIEKAQARLLVLVYLVAMLVGQPIAGRISDRVGAKRLTVIALWGFAACSLGAVFARSFGALVAARTVQAVFAAALAPAASSMLRAVVPAGERGRAFGIQGSVVGMGVAVGPLVGGQLVDSVNWKAIFLVNLPVVAVCLFMLSRVPVPSLRSMIRTDEAEPTHGSLWNLTFSAAFATQALSNFGQYTLLLMCPAVLEAQDWDAASIGWVLTAMTAGLIVFGPIGGRYGDNHGRRTPVLGGLTVAAAGVAVLIPFNDGVSVYALVTSLALFGIGFGVAVPGLSAAGIESAPMARTATAAGWLSMSRYIGSIAATSLINALVDDDGRGARTMFGIATTSVLLAVATALVVVRHAPGPRATPAALAPTKT